MLAGMKLRLLRNGSVSLFALVAALSAGGVTARADGGFSFPSGGSTTATAGSRASTGAQSDYLNYSSTTFANASVDALSGGKILEGSAGAGNAQLLAIGQANCLGQDGSCKTSSVSQVSSNTNSENNSFLASNASKAVVYAKGGNIVAKARSQTTTTIFVGGHAYVVAVEVARALARYTPYGTSAVADSQASISAASNGYIGVNTGTKNEATVRVVQP
jgi:hypothetical protein